MGGQKLAMKVKLGFGVCDLGGNLFFTVIAFVFLNYLTDTIGFSAAMAGLISMLGKFWDAFTDPLVGYLSDRTRSRWGRRRPWILFGSVPLFLTMILMFTNPELTNDTALFVWGLLAYCLLCTAYTTVNIPYNSLTPELTQDFHERTTLNGYRFGFAVVGTLLGAGAALPIIGLFADKNTGYTIMGAIFGAVMMVTAMATVFAVREPQVKRPESSTGLVETYLGVFRNRPYVIILATYTLDVVGITIVSGVAIYYFKYLHNNESMTTPAMIIMLVTAMVFILVSVMLSKKIGKKTVYALGMSIKAAALLVLFFFGHRYSLNFSLGMMFFLGIGFGFTYAMPYAIVPDAVEYNYLRTGERTEGAFYGIWTFGIKIGQAIALGAITGAVLSVTGFVANVAQTDSALFGIRLLLGPIPAAVFILGVIVLRFYPIDEARYQEILDQIKHMESKLRTQSP